MKEVLIIYYTQSGQLRQILDNIVSGFDPERTKVTYYEIVPEEPFEFPWKPGKFYDAFPESFLQVPSKLNPPSGEILGKKYDLVVLGYQVWYLTPSIPINSFLKSGHAKKLLAHTPVVTVVACRNMWIQAQEKMKRLLAGADAKLVGHIALVDNNVNHISVITIAHWMFSGKKDRYLGVFPKPGVSDRDIERASRFSAPIQNALVNGGFGTLQERLLVLGAAPINAYLVQVDKRGNAVFSKWANLIVKKGGPGDQKRLKWVGLFKYYLLFAIWLIAPLVFIVFLLTYLPMYQKRNNEKRYYSSVALKQN